MTPKQEKRQRSVLTTAYNDYEKGLNKHAFFKVGDRVVGEDLVQDTFIKTWGYLVKGGKVEIMRAFLYHVLNHLIVDQYRKRKTTSLDLLMEKGFEPGIDSSKNLFDTLDTKAVLLLIQELPEKYRKVMHMRYAQNLSLEEMSLITGQSKNTIAVQTYRGLKKLKLLCNPK